MAGRAKFAPGEVSVSVRSSIRVEVTAPMSRAAVPLKPRARSRVKMTSSVVTGEPSAKVAPLRSRRVSQLPSGDMVNSARPDTGVVWSSSANVVRVS